MAKKKIVKKKKAPKKASVVVGKVSRRGKLTPKQKERYLNAMQGNSWWQMRSKHGKDRIFSDPKIMAEAANEYFDWCDKNPEKRAELVKYEGSAKEEEVSVKRLYTKSGLCIFLHVNTAYFRQFKQDLRAKDPNSLTAIDRDYATVIHAIEDVIENQQVSGAASGFFNGNIISRLVGLIDKKDVTSNNETISAPVVKVYNVGPSLAGSEEDVED